MDATVGMNLLDPYRVEIERALEAGVSKAEISRALKVSRGTLNDSLDRWARPERVKPGAEELAALRRLVEGDQPA